jgi:hypothetical protein
MRTSEFEASSMTRFCALVRRGKYQDAIDIRPEHFEVLQKALSDNEKIKGREKEGKKERRKKIGSSRPTNAN